MNNQHLMLGQLDAYRAAQSVMHTRNITQLQFGQTSLVVVSFRDTELVITRSWLKVNAYEVRQPFTARPL